MRRKTVLAGGYREGEKETGASEKKSEYLERDGSTPEQKERGDM